MSSDKNNEVCQSRGTRSVTIAPMLPLRTELHAASCVADGTRTEVRKNIDEMPSMGMRPATVALIPPPHRTEIHGTGMVSNCLRTMVEDDNNRAFSGSRSVESDVKDEWQSEGAVPVAETSS